VANDEIQEIQGEKWTYDKLVITHKKDDIYLTPASGKYDSVLVWLHGIGDTSKGLTDLFKTQDTEGTNMGWHVMGNTRVVLPKAKKRFLELQGDVGINKWHSWFNIRSLGDLEDP
jgi:predicted esterase